MRNFPEYRKFIDRGTVSQRLSACFLLMFHNRDSFCC